MSQVAEMMQVDFLFFIFFVLSWERGTYVYSLGIILLNITEELMHYNFKYIKLRRKKKVR